MILSTIVALTILCLLVALLAYARSRSSALGDNEFASDPSVSDRESFADYYRPMLRMLDSRELASARSLGGVAQSDFSRFRARRISSFRAYLYDLRLDFHRIDFKMRYLLLSASAQEADLVQQLNGIKLKFQMQLWRVEFQLLAFRLGYGSIEITPLIEMLEQFESGLIRRPAMSAASA